MRIYKPKITPYQLTRQFPINEEKKRIREDKEQIIKKYQRDNWPYTN